MGVVEKPINNSKGCGGVMRTAPVGLIFGPADAFVHGMDYAALIACILAGDALEDAIVRCNQLLVAHPGHEETLDLVLRAVEAYHSGTDVESAIRQLGEGWIGEEALGIALFCVLRFPDDYAAAVIAAANHDGDTDSTASMAGAILGAKLGAAAIPQEWIEQIENRNQLEELAAALARIPNT